MKVIFGSVKYYVYLVTIEDNALYKVRFNALYMLLGLVRT